MNHIEESIFLNQMAPMQRPSSLKPTSTSVSYFHNNEVKQRYFKYS
uniref:Uncharacterized protein n=1 Tax=Lepeophtheirus salmonis TaxID=72036 RepID=A0A0K2UAE2_LEPSM